MHENRLTMEKQVVETMVRLYCRKHHRNETLCEECSDLLAYAKSRIDHCPEGSLKPFCSRCVIHCYAPDYREKIRKVMRFSGPRMLLYHPVIAIRHVVSSCM